MLHIIAFLTAKPGQRDLLLRELRGNVEAVRREQGCVEYLPVVDVPRASRVQSEAGPDTVVVVERWVSKDAWKAHMTAPHMAAYAERVRDVMESRRVFVLSEPA